MENMNEKVCFVILHYKTVEDTINCIESILQLENQKCIVVVDNASNNCSIEKIEEKYKTNETIYYIKNNKNLGFAGGNNIGYSFARNKLNAKFILVLNNDIIIDSRDIISQLISEYNKNQYYLAGPDIISATDGKHQNPMNTNKDSKVSISKEILRYRLLYFLSKIKIYDYLKHNKTSTLVPENTKVQKEQEYIQLHGSFIVFSPLFISKEVYAFRPGTFLYMEESILNKYCEFNNYKTIYIPNIKVYHKEDSSTNSLFCSDKNKREFVFKNMIKSLKVYRKVL